MEGIEHHGGRRGLKDGGNVGLHVDRSHPVALLLQRMAAGAPRGEADLALGRPAAHEDRNVFGSHVRSPTPAFVPLPHRPHPEEPLYAERRMGSGEWGVGGAPSRPLPKPQARSPKRHSPDEPRQPLPPSRIPTRLISHSSSTPACSRTRRRTSSPSPSISAALARPWLIRKLQCISETCASPRRRPRQPAASISFQAFVPAGFLKVDPPVRVLTGCVDERASVMAFISARISAGSPGCPWKTASMKTTSSGTLE